VHALDVNRTDVLDAHFPEVGEDVVLGDLAVLENCPFPTGELLPVEPVVNEAFQCDADAFAGQTGVDSGQRLFDSVIAFPLGLAVLRHHHTVYRFIKSDDLLQKQ